MNKYKKYLLLFLGSLLVLSACRQSAEPIIGYVDVDYTYIASNFSGVLNKLFVQRGSPVQKGTPLFELDKEPEASKLASAKASLLQATENREKQEADLTLLQSKLNRRTTLRQQGSISAEDLQIAQAEYNKGNDALQAAKGSEVQLIAEVQQAQWALAKKSITSPLNGYVLDTYYTAGEYVPAEHPVLALFAPENIKVVFFVSEALHRTIRFGQKVQVYSDQHQTPVDATISYISPKEEYTPPVVYSNETRSKLIYRIEAKPLLDKNKYPFNPGEVVNVELNPESGDNSVQ